MLNFSRLLRSLNHSFPGRVGEIFNKQRRWVKFRLILTPFNYMQFTELVWLQNCYDSFDDLVATVIIVKTSRKNEINVSLCWEGKLFCLEKNLLVLKWRPINSTPTIWLGYQTWGTSVESGGSHICSKSAPHKVEVNAVSNNQYFLMVGGGSTMFMDHKPSNELFSLWCLTLWNATLLA